MTFLIIVTNCYYNEFKFAKNEKIDLTFVGPEDPLINGIADLFDKNNLKIVGPVANASKMEGSKIFSKNLMKKYKIPSVAKNGIQFSRKRL